MSKSPRCTVGRFDSRSEATLAFPAVLCSWRTAGAVSALPAIGAPAVAVAAPRVRAAAC